MNCKNVQASLSAYLDRELDREEMLEIRQHLADCERCSEEEASLSSLKHLLRDVPSYEPSAEFEQRLVSNVLGAPAETGNVVTKVSYLLVSSVAAAAMLATLVVLSALGRQGDPQVMTNTPGSDVVFDISRDRAFDAGSDPLSGTPVVMPMNYERH
jgi:anti-sigma factor RsiW